MRPLAALALATVTLAPALRAQTITVTYPASVVGAAAAVPATRPLDGRLVVLITPDSTREPRFQLSPEVETAQGFGVDVRAWRPGTPLRLDDARVSAGDVFGAPVATFAALPPGTYTVQAVLNRYEPFRLATGQTVLLPPDRGEGQQWNRKPGNLLSAPVRVRLGPGARVRLVLDRMLPAVEPPRDTEWLRRVTVTSERLSAFYGRPMTLSALVLLPAGWATHSEARYPLAVFHGHFPAAFGGFRPTPPDTTRPCVARGGIACANRLGEQEAYDFYRTWSGPGFPRFLVIQIQHPTPYYDDSYAVNSASQGPWGDAIVHDLIPEVERRFRGLGEGWARFTYGGSTGGWEALASQVFYPDAFNGAFAACPDPVDFRFHQLVDIYDHANAYADAGPFTAIERPAARDSLGRLSSTTRSENHMELVLGTRTRSGGQWDAWEATFSPQGPDGYPARLWDKKTGAIDRSVAAYWREHYDLRHILQRDWATLGPRLRGKLHVYVGDMDTYYLNDAVYLLEAFLKGTTAPPADATVVYGDRREHCFNGDMSVPNAVASRRYNTMYVPRMLQRMQATAPSGADLTSWRY